MIAAAKANKSGSQTTEEEKPRFVALIYEHHVRSGESLESLARLVGLTKDELADFNWGTNDLGEINEHLYGDVGCTKTGKDGKSYVLDDIDWPGIIYIPRRWKSSNLAINREHVLRVRKVRKDKYQFSL